MKKLFGNLGSSIFGIYIFIAIVSAAYFNWQYARDNGFMKWVAFGEVVATVKGGAWPYFIFFSPSPRGSVRHFVNSIKYVDAAQEFGKNLKSPDSMSGSEMKTFIGFYKEALREAESVDTEVLNNRLASFGDHYRDEFVRGLKMTIAGQEESDAIKSLEGQILLITWENWYAENIERIRGH